MPPSYVPNDAENIEDYGAQEGIDSASVGESNVDAILDACAASSGSNVYIPAGEYYVADQSSTNLGVIQANLSQYYGLSVYGAGPTESFLTLSSEQATTENNKQIFRYSNGPHGTVEFRGWTMDGNLHNIEWNSDGDGKLQEALQFSATSADADHFIMEDFRCRNIHNEGFSISEDMDLTVQRCTFVDIGIGRTNDMDGSSINHMFTDSPDTGYEFVFEDCEFRLTSGNVIDPLAGSVGGEIRFKNCWCSGIGDALIKEKGMDSIVIDNLYFEANTPELEDRLNQASIDARRHGRSLIRQISGVDGKLSTITLNNVYATDMLDMFFQIGGSSSTHHWQVNGGDEGPLVIDGHNYEDVYPHSIRCDDGSMTFDFGDMSVHGNVHASRIFDARHDTFDGHIENLHWDDHDELGQLGSLTLGNNNEGGAPFTADVPEQHEVGIDAEDEPGPDPDPDPDPQVYHLFGESDAADWDDSQGESGVHHEQPDGTDWASADTVEMGLPSDPEFEGGNVVAHYGMGESDGDVLHEISETIADGSYINNPALGAASGPLGFQAPSFDATDETYATTNHSFAPETGEVGVVVVFRKDSWSGSWGKFVSDFDGSGTSIDLTRHSDNNAVAWASGDNRVEGTTDVADGEWHWLSASVSSDGDYELYIDNTVEATDTFTAPDLSLGGDAGISALPDGERLEESDIASVLILDGPLTATDRDYIHETYFGGTADYWTSTHSADAGSDTLTLETSTSIPQGAGITVTLYQDVDGAGGGEETDALGNPYDHSETISLTSGDGVEHTVEGFVDTDGEDTWWLHVEFSADDEDVTTEAPKLHSYDVYGRSALFDDWELRWHSEESDWAVIEEASNEGDAMLELDSDIEARTALSLAETGTDVYDADVVTLVSIPEDNDPYGAWCRTHLRGSGFAGSESSYYSEIHLTDELVVGRYLNGTVEQLRSVSFDYEPGTWLMTRFRADGEDLRYRVWEYGESEPDEWDIEVSDDNIDTGGWVGLGGFSADRQLFDYVSIGVDGARALVEPPRPVQPQRTSAGVISSHNGVIQTITDQ